MSELVISPNGTLKYNGLEGKLHDDLLLNLVIRKSLLLHTGNVPLKPSFEKWDNRFFAQKHCLIYRNILSSYKDFDFNLKSE